MDIEEFNFENHYQSVNYWRCNNCGEDVPPDNDEMFEHYNDCNTEQMKKIEKEALDLYMEQNMWIFGNWQQFVEDMLGEETGNEYRRLCDD
jgi:hypothetical protein